MRHQQHTRKLETYQLAANPGGSTRSCKGIKRCNICCSEAPPGQEQPTAAGGTPVPPIPGDPCSHCCWARWGAAERRAQGLSGSAWWLLGSVSKGARWDITTHPTTGFPWDRHRTDCWCCRQASRTNAVKNTQFVLCILRFPWIPPESLRAGYWKALQSHHLIMNCN